MPIVGSKITEGKKALSDLVQVLSDKRYGRSVRPKDFYRSSFNTSLDRAL